MLDSICERPLIQYPVWMPVSRVFYPYYFGPVDIESSPVTTTYPGTATGTSLPQHQMAAVPFPQQSRCPNHTSTQCWSTQTMHMHIPRSLDTNLPLPVNQHHLITPLHILLDNYVLHLQITMGEDGTVTREHPLWCLAAELGASGFK